MGLLGKTHLFIPDSHAHPDFNNNRADLLGKLILDLKPDVVINIGDMWDMPSMSAYDKGRKSFMGRTFKKDIDAGLDFDERMWYPLRKAKKKRPRTVFLEGNHEYRLKRAIEIQPELEGTISFEDFDLKRNYSDIVEYVGGTPGIINIDGINYAHYFISGVLGRSIAGERPAHMLLAKQHESCTAGHLHTLDYAIRPLPSGRKIMGLIGGVFQDYDSPWAGEINKQWWRGLIIKRNVEDGHYDPEFVSIERLKKAYS